MRLDRNCCMDYSCFCATSTAQDSQHFQILYFMKIRDIEATNCVNEPAITVILTQINY